MSSFSLGGALGAPGEAWWEAINARGSRPRKGASPRELARSFCRFLIDLGWSLHVSKQRQLQKRAYLQKQIIWGNGVFGAKTHFWIVLT